jgi:D-xylose transport system permease protein
MAGIHEPDAGEIIWEGKPVRIRSPREAAALGIEVVYQDLALCDNLDVVENMFLGREVLTTGLLDEDSMERSASKILSDLRVTTLQSVREPVASLSGGQRQSIAVATAAMWTSKLVILDEPTAALGVAQTKQVLDLVRHLAGQGLAVIMVSHNLNDVFSVADRLAMLRLGKLVAVGDASQFDPQMAVELMTLGQTSRTPDCSSRLDAEEFYDRGRRADETPAASGARAAPGKPAEAVPVRGSSLWDYPGAMGRGAGRAERRSARRDPAPSSSLPCSRARTRTSSHPAISSIFWCRLRSSCSSAWARHSFFCSPRPTSRSAS